MVSRAIKKKETREQLIEVATKLFQEKGFEQTTVDDIVAVAGVSQRTFFRYFASKMDIAFPYHEQRLNRFGEFMEKEFTAANPFVGPSRAVGAFAKEYALDKEQLQQEWRLVDSSPGLSARDRDLDFNFEILLAKTLVRGGFGDREAAILAGAIFGSMRAAIHLWLLNGCEDDITEMGAPTLRMLDFMAVEFERKGGLFEATASQA